MRSLLVLVVALLPACNILVSAADCPDLDATCPDLQCDNYKQNRDGCSICECEQPAVVVCWDDTECGDGQRCDSVDFCERAPNCSADGPCPDACYGRCVDGAVSCASDSDCPAGQVCGAIDNGGGANERPSTGGDGSDVAPVPAPNGVCIDVTCQNTDVALPECPPGSEVGFDASVDPCNPTCVQVDPCRDLGPDQCALAVGCQLIADTGCVSIDDCSVLGVDTCESNPNCVLKPVGNTTDPTTGDGGAPAPACDPNQDPNCTSTDPPPDLVCVSRSSDGTCFSDADCLAGETCTLTTVCGTGCEVGSDGTQLCFDQCWNERGFCGAGDGSCASLTPDQCLADAACTLVDSTSPGLPCQCDPSTPDGGCDCAPPPVTQVCVPLVTSCTTDGECAAGQHCEVVESCPVCDPSGSDLNCAAPCFVEGTCVDGAPPPVNCNVDADCGDGGACVAVTVCEACSDQPSPGSGGADQPAPAPPPCDPACHDENVCVAAPVVGGGVPCQADADCGAGQRCAVKLASPVCVDDTATSGSFCASDEDCAAFTSSNGGTATCRFRPDVCPVDPVTGACDGWCVSTCAAVLTPAIDPATGQCVTFDDSCIPPGWVTTDACPQP